MGTGGSCSLSYTLVRRSVDFENAELISGQERLGARRRWLVGMDKGAYAAKVVPSDLED